MWPFTGNKQGAVSMEFVKPESNRNFHENHQVTPMSPTPSNSKLARLMELIGFAIDSWAKEYHLENMPKKIIFEQAFDAMNAIERTINNKET